MAKHWQEEHQDEEKPTFKMQVARNHTSALVRQVHEAVIIEMATENNNINVLNSKGEYNRCQLPRLGVKMGKKCVDEEELPSEEDQATYEEELYFEDKKRRQEEQELTQPPGKKKRTRYDRKPSPKRPVKRTWSADHSENNHKFKMARIDPTEEPSKKKKTASEILKKSKSVKNVPSHRFAVHSNFPTLFEFQ